MNNSKIIILAGVIVAGGMLIYFRNRPTVAPAPTINLTVQQGKTNPNWDTKTDDQASVTVTITPLDLAIKSQEWKFDIVMDTHTVPLEQDMLKIAVLVDDSGNVYKPIRWDGAAAGGHHREGVLVFAAISRPVKTVELKISGIAGVERTLTWQL